MFGSDNRRKRWYDILGLVPKKVVRWLIILSFIPIAVAIVLGIYAWRANEYDMGQILAPLENSVAYDDKGLLIGTLSEQTRVNISRKDLPDHLVKAFVAREDDAFFDHSGIVYTSMLRSLLRNVSSFSYMQGGSTITMQLARNTFELREKTIDRKILEIAIARRIEDKYDKDTILTSYLNRIYFGEQCYGIAQAAHRYFGKRVSDLNLSESATLAGIVRGPSIFNPVQDLDAAIRQRDATLDRMVECGYITGQQADETKKEKLKLASGMESEAHSYPIQWISSQLDKYDDGIDMDTSSIYVLTTFNLSIQRDLELLVEPRIRELEASPVWKDLPKRIDDKAEGCLQVAALCVETGTGNILAVIGGRCPIDGIDRWSLKRKPGLLFLPFVNLAAADAGKNIIRNTPLSTGRTVGYSSVIDVGEQLGIKSDLPRSDSLYEGEFKTSLLPLVRGFLMIQNKGRQVELSSIRQIATNRKRLIFQRPPAGNDEIFKRESSFVVSSLPPFLKNDRKKIATMDVELPDCTGHFHALIGRQYSLFLWLGFDDKKEAYWKKKGVSKAIDALGKNIVTDIYDKLTGKTAEPAQEPAQAETANPAPSTTP